MVSLGVLGSDLSGTPLWVPLKEREEGVLNSSDVFPNPHMEIRPAGLGTHQDQGLHAQNPFSLSTPPGPHPGAGEDISRLRKLG